MALDSEQLSDVRSWVGDELETAYLDGLYDVFLDDYTEAQAVAHTIRKALRYRLAQLTLDQPAGLSTPEGLSIQQGENIRALQEQLRSFESSALAIAAGGGAVGVGKLHRPDGR